MRFLFVTAFTLFISAGVFAQQMQKPTKHHEFLKDDVGTWTGTMSMVLPGSDQEIKMPVKETAKLIAGGLWLVSDFETGPFVGHGQFGYDVKKEKYVGTWIDNSSSHLNVMEGEFFKDKGEMVMTFQGVDGATGKIEEMKSVSTRDGKDKRKFVMYTKRDGNWVKSFEINYQRVE